MRKDQTVPLNLPRCFVPRRRFRLSISSSSIIKVWSNAGVKTRGEDFTTPGAPPDVKHGPPVLMAVARFNVPLWRASAETTGFCLNHTEHGVPQMFLDHAALETQKHLKHHAFCLGLSELSNP